MKTMAPTRGVPNPLAALVLLALPVTLALSAGACRETPTAPAQDPSVAAAPDDDLLATRGLADGAPDWTLAGARAASDLGRNGGPALILQPGADGTARASVRLDPAPAGTDLEFSVLAQGLADGQRVILRAVGTTEAGETVLSTDRTLKLAVDDWRRGILDVRVPSEATRLELSVALRGSGPVLVCEPALQDAVSSDVLGSGTELTALGERELAAAARAIEPAVERLRGHLFEAPVPVQVVSDADARAFFLKRLERDYPRERATFDTIALTQLGLWPEGVDMIDALLALLEEQAGGFYDPEVDTFFLLSDMPSGIAPILMAHELTHALDDQVHDIDGGIAAVKDDADASMAYGSVVEGSGTLIMGVFLGEEIAEGRMSLSSVMAFQSTEAGKAETLMSSPPLLARNLVAPYVMGQRFLLRGGGAMAAGDFDNADIDRAFARPPRSSEQILHPEKYWRPDAADPPRAVALPDLSAVLGEGWSKVREDTLGELGLAVMTGSGMPDPNSLAGMAPSSWTNAAATGWGGDRFQLYAHADGVRHATLLATVWDSARDAEEFHGALHLKEGSVVRRAGDAVVIVAGDAGAAAGSLAGTVLERLGAGS